MARIARDALSRHPTHGYRLTIGKKPDGKPRLFWLGKELPKATYHAHTLRQCFGAMARDGRDVWSRDDERWVAECVEMFANLTRNVPRVHAADLKRLDDQREALVREQRIVRQVLHGDADALPAPTAIDDAPAGKATLYGAIAAYSANMRGKRKSDRHIERACQVVEVNLKRARKDCPLAAIDYVWIDSLCDHYKSRPPNLKDGTAMTSGGVKNVLTYLRLFFTWLDDTGFGGWEGPRKMLKPFKLRVADLMTNAELRDAGTIAQFDLPTLGKLYRAANDFQRTMMLMALFTGATQQELAGMERSEFDLDAARLVHLRNKTKVQGEYWLPPELVKLLRAQFADRPGDKLAFRTREGNPLVTFKGGRQTSDAVRQSWDDLRDAAELPDALSFKYLRKFLADWMTRHGGEEMGQVALSHSRQSVLSRNYTNSRDFTRFNGLQRAMSAELMQAFSTASLHHMG